MKRLSFLLVALVLLAGCGLLPGDSATPVPTARPTPALSAEDVARAFLKAWSEADYNAMYSMVAPSRKATIPADQFLARYKGIATEATITKVTPTFLASSEQGNQAEARFSVAFETIAAGAFQQDNSMSLQREDERWGVLWTPGLIFAQLAGGGTVHLYPLASARADLFDRKGRALTVPQQQVVIEVVPAEMKNEGAVLAALAKVLNLQPAAIRSMYSRYPGDWRTAVGAVTPDEIKKNLDGLNQPGIRTDTIKDIRVYPRGPLAAHVLGYVGVVSAEDLARLSSRGYREGDFVGKAGLELWGESNLAGQRGGKLTILSPTGAITATLANVPAKQSQSIYTTLDVDLQDIAEKALGNKVGAVVALDITNGAILAMASHPTFDPNRLSQRMSTQDWRTLINDPNNPLINRAAQSAFPPGSVFKIVSFSAAVEKGGLTPTTLFEDPGFWDGLGKSNRKFCWTWATTGKGHGKLTLAQALTTSCDVTFYQVGVKLNQADQNLLTTFARAFGLGADTGFELQEAEGNVPDPRSVPTWGAGDAVNLVIGQGTMLTSPLQIADMLAAVANGGTLYRPYLVARISNIVDKTEKITKSEVRGKLPISPPTLAALREALKRVTTDKDGTAYYAFRNAKIVSAGKTGTAEVFKGGEPHAWFAGYAPADAPRIALVVMVEHGGEGSKAAAPVFREIVDKYFTGPGK